MNTHESYVSLETAKMLKEAGFDWGTLTYYPIDDKVLNERALVGSKVAFNHNRDDSAYSAPTLDVAQRWLREVKGIFVNATNYRQEGSINYTMWRWYYHSNDSELSDTGWSLNTYEEALEAGIKKCLTILLEEKK